MKCGIEESVLVKVWQAVRALSAGILVTALSFACSSDYSEKISLSGSSTVAPLAQEIAARFEKQHPGVRVDVQTGGSSRGVTDVSKGLVDIGMASRQLHAQETGLTPHTIAWDGVTIIVNKANPIATLDADQVRAIYTGKVTNWRELGSFDKPIVVVNKAEGHSTLELFLNFYQLKNNDVHAQIIIGDNQQAIKTVAGNPLAIGYVSIGSAEFEATHNVAIKLVSLGNIDANVLNVAKGVFPLSRPLNLLSTEKTSQLAREFIQFAQSSQVDDIIEQQFFVPNAR